MREFRHFLCASAVTLAAVLTAGCDRHQGSEIAEKAAPIEVSPRPRLPVAEQPIDRAALLSEAAKAASAAALGQSDADQQRRLDGKLFEIRIRFGCAASVDQLSGGKGFDVRFSEKGRTLRVRAAPDLTLDDPPVTALAGEASEAVEGFWMDRPWLLTDGCPTATLPTEPADTGTRDPSAGTRPQDPAAAKPSLVLGYRVGLAQFFTEADSRTARRDQRAYEASKVLGATEEPSVVGYNLVLSGRLRQLPNGRVISCPVTRLDAPPECVVSAKFDRVRIEEPRSRDVLAEWGS